MDFTVGTQQSLTDRLAANLSSQYDVIVCHNEHFNNISNWFCYKGTLKKYKIDNNFERI